MKSIRESMMEDISFVIPTDKDVKCGRGDSNFKHAGNQYLRTLIASQVAHFENCTMKSQKTALIAVIIEEIFSKGGRFLRHNSIARKWYDGGIVAAKLRVGVAFRDAVARRKKGMPPLGEKEVSNPRRERQESTSRDATPKQKQNSHLNEIRQHQFPFREPDWYHDWSQENSEFQVGLRSGTFASPTYVNVYCANKEGEAHCNLNGDQLKRSTAQNKERHRKKIDSEKATTASRSSTSISSLRRDAAARKRKKAIDGSIGVHCNNNEEEDCDGRGSEEKPGEILQNEDLSRKLDCKEFSWLKYRVSVAFRDAVARRKRSLSLCKISP